MKFLASWLFGFLAILLFAGYLGLVVLGWVYDRAMSKLFPKGNW